MEAIFKRFHPRVCRLAFALCGHPTEAEDIAQEVFVAVLRGIDGFRGEAELGTWIYRITTRVAGRHVARRGRVMTHVIDTEGFAGGSDAETDAQLAELAAAMDTLSIPLRTVLSLVAIEGLSHEAVADVLGVPVGTVWSRLYNARRQLAEAMAHG